MVHGIVIPIDKALPKAEIENILIQGEVSAIFFEEKYIDTIKEIQKDVSFLEYLICFNNVYDNSIKSFDSLLELGNLQLKKNDTSFIDSKIDNNATNILLFTSRDYIKFQSSNAFTS